ncbi:glycosyltransferase family 4 protein [Microbacterium sp. UMB0228]|uniref:glycosyltransferase family 4 protein n=1 Tax=Microbacterium sp. UMB0228 TaxID=2029109 RepID=UPI0015E0D515|nr:glycosyltransferase family 4 protein [Microbacterium sp. UMB0228]
MKPTVVVHVIGSLDHGGAEKVALDLCEAIPAARATQVFYCFSGREGALAPRFRQAGAVVSAAPAGGTLARARALRRLVREHGAHVVVSHVSLASAFLLLAVCRTGVRRRIARAHSTGDDRGGGLRAAYRTAARALLPFSATHVAGVSDAALRFLVGRWGRLHRWLGVDNRVLVNGVDVGRFHATGEEQDVRPPRVVHVGRASPEKNRRVLVPIFRALRAMKPVEMWVVGPGGTADLGELPGDGGFRVAGVVDDAAPILREADVLLLPSLREGLPGVVLEALASGVPVVASDLPTLRELEALPGVFFVPPNAAVSEWAAAVARAMDMSSADRRSLAEAVRRSRFTLERSVNDWLALW